MNRPWFDDKTGLLILDEHVAEMPSFRKILGDEMVSEEELREQAGKVAALFRELENSLAPEARARVTDALCELAVLQAMQHRSAGKARTDTAPRQ